MWMATVSDEGRAVYVSVRIMNEDILAGLKTDNTTLLAYILCPC